MRFSHLINRHKPVNKVLSDYIRSELKLKNRFVPTIDEFKNSMDTPIRYSLVVPEEFKAWISFAEVQISIDINNRTLIANYMHKHGSQMEDDYVQFDIGHINLDDLSL